jgi:anti-sigma B factor antagonist
MASALQVQSSVIANSDGEVHVLAAEGELDMATRAALQRELDALVDGTGRRLLVDLSRLEFIDSAGITTLYQAGAGFAHLAVVVAAGSQVARILELCGMDELLPLFVRRDEAVRALV